MASEEVGSGQTAADVKEEETQFPALRYNFLIQTHDFHQAMLIITYIAMDLSDQTLPLGSHSGS